MRILIFETTLITKKKGGGGEIALVGQKQLREL